MILKGFYEAARMGSKSYLAVEIQTAKASVFRKIIVKQLKNRE